MMPVTGRLVHCSVMVVRGVEKDPATGHEREVVRMTKHGHGKQAKCSAEYLATKDREFRKAVKREIREENQRLQAEARSQSSGGAEHDKG